jgi:hypothetical protein
MIKSETQQLHELVRRTLQAARVEVARRLQVINLPLSLTIQQMTIERTEQQQDAGWRSGQEDVQVGTLYIEELLFRISDDSVSHQLLGLRDQLQPLADYLNEMTDLAAKPSPFLSSQTGAEALLVRYVHPLAIHYLQSLTNLGVDDQEIIEYLTAELEELISQDAIFHTSQLALAGVLPSGEYKHRGVTLRPLLPRERGILAERRMLGIGSRPLPGSNFIPPSSFTLTLPSALLEITTKRPFTQQFDSSTLPNRMALALFLSGYEISGTGTMPSFDRPVWASFGVGHGPFPVFR